MIEKLYRLEECNTKYVMYTNSIQLVKHKLIIIREVCAAPFKITPLFENKLKECLIWNLQER